MNARFSKMTKVCLLIIALSWLWWAWYLTEQTYHEFTVEGVGQFEFAIEKTMWNIFIGNGGSTIKKLYWVKPDGTEIRYEFDKGTHGYWRLSIFLLENGEGLYLVDERGPAFDELYLNFADEILYGCNHCEKYVDGERVTTFSWLSHTIPDGVGDLNRTLLSKGSPSMIEGILVLGFHIGWVFLLPINFICALILAIKVFKTIIKRSRRRLTV